MKLILFTAILLTSAFAHSASENVWLQCSLEGPVYPGQIEYPAELSDWVITEAQNDSCELKSVNPLRLQFNGMTYSSANPFTLSFELNANTCAETMSQEGLTWVDDTSVQLKNQYGFTTEITLKSADGRKFELPDSIGDDVSKCSISK